MKTLTTWELFKNLEVKLAYPYEDKLALTKATLESLMRKHKNAVVMCSFGKDSVTVLHLALQYNKNVKVVFVNTGIEYKQTIAFKDKLVKKWDLNYTELHPDTTFWSVIKKHGLPSPSRWRSGTPRCCYHLKEKPAIAWVRENKPKLILDGLTASESRIRKMFFLNGLSRQTKKWGCLKASPIAYWTPEDVWRYHRENNIPRNKAYNFAERVGCAYCTAHTNWEKQLSHYNPKVYKFIQEEFAKQTLLLKK